MAKKRKGRRSRRAKAKRRAAANELWAADGAAPAAAAAAAAPAAAAPAPQTVAAPAPAPAVVHGDVGVHAAHGPAQDDGLDPLQPYFNYLETGSMNPMSRAPYFGNSERSQAERPSSPTAKPLTSGFVRRLRVACGRSGAALHGGAGADAVDGVGALGPLTCSAAFCALWSEVVLREPTFV